jgi:hypothetical protein
LNEQIPLAEKAKKNSSSVHVQDVGNLDSERVINVKSMGSVNQSMKNSDVVQVHKDNTTSSTITAPDEQGIRQFIF